MRTTTSARRRAVATALTAALAAVLGVVLVVTPPGVTPRGDDAPLATTATPRQGSDATTVDGSTTAALTPLQRVEAIADATGFDWRAVDGELVVGCAPTSIQARCTLGAYVTRTRRMHIAPAAFTDAAVLEYVVLHELAHLWQFTTAPASLRAGVMAPFGLTGLHALESGADCLASHWGARFPGPYGCPEGAAVVVGELYAATVD